MQLFPDWKTLARSGYLFRIVDTGEDSTVDRVTVLFSDGDALMCDRCGGLTFSQWTGPVDPAVLAEWVEDGTAVDLASDDLSDDEKAHILRRVNEGWQKCLEHVASGRVAASRASAYPNEGTHACGAEGLYRTATGAFMVRSCNLPEDDRGPFTCPAAALRATLPDEYGLSGSEYHSPAFPEE